MYDMLNLYGDLVNKSTNGIYVTNIDTYELLYLNQTARELLKKDNQCYKGKKCYEFIFNSTSPCEFCKLNLMEKEKFVERDYKDPITDKTFCLEGRLSEWNGIPVHVEYIQDVTKNRKIIEENVGLKKQAEEALENYRALVDTVPGGIAKYEVIDKNVRTKYYSDGLCEISGYTRQERDNICGENAIALTYDDDIPYLLSAIDNAITNETNLYLNYRIKTKSGEPRYVNLNATYSRGKNGYPEFNAVFSDIDDFKKMEESLKEQKLRYEIALKSSGINVWEYDIASDKLKVISNSVRIKQNCFTINNYILSTVENGYVREDCIETFYSIFERIKKGEKEIIEDIWYKTTDEVGFWCERVIYTTVFDENGTPIKAFGAGKDVTREKEAIKRFNEEMSYRAVMQETILDSIKINLTRNTIIDGESPFNILNQLISSNDADYYFEKTPYYIMDKKDRQEYRKKFNRKTLLNCFNGGDYSSTMEFARVFDTKRIYWIKYSVHIMRNPETKDIIAFVVAYDITDEKVMEIIMQTVTKTEYDFFIVVDGITNSASDYSTTGKNHRFREEDIFEQKNEEFLRECVCPDDVEMVIKNCKIVNILKKTQNGQVYRFNFSMKEKTGEIRRKQLQFTLISPSRKSFLMTRIDVNSVYLEEQSSKKRLELALETAKKASSIKTDFLARMSHDMRTPMNGILGLLNLTLEEPSLTSVVKNNLKGIYDSSQYLLSLINDTLDMSKIESNKLVLNYKIVKAENILNSIIELVMPLARKKNIDLLIVPNNMKDVFIKTDPIRLHQIFVNIISNSIKFTPEGGKIEIIVQQLKKENEIVYYKIIVRDNGIGMGKEFLPKLFEPFEQEQKTISSDYEGTGLGMSIVKRIIELMGDTIEVKSELGVGTEIVTYMNFEEICDCVPYKTVESINVENLRNKRILICEDHPLNAKIATRLLEKKGIITEIAQNGQKAVDLFSKSENKYYDGILMDIRMPVMDGIEATKQIRELNRKDSKTVPIIAMTANAFEEDIQKSLDAGMNAHLAKPVEPSILFEILAELING